MNKTKKYTRKLRKKIDKKKLNVKEMDSLKEIKRFHNCVCL